MMTREQLAELEAHIEDMDGEEIEAYLEAINDCTESWS